MDYVVGWSKYDGGWRWTFSSANPAKSGMTDIRPATAAETIIIDQIIAADRLHVQPAKLIAAFQAECDKWKARK